MGLAVKRSRSGRFPAVLGPRPPGASVRRSGSIGSTGGPAVPLKGVTVRLASVCYDTTWCALSLSCAVSEKGRHGRELAPFPLERNAFAFRLGDRSCW